jgi:hypothetical protein
MGCRPCCRRRRRDRCKSSVRLDRQCLQQHPRHNFLAVTLPRSRHLVLGAAALIVHASSGVGQSPAGAPYSTLTVRGGVTDARTADPLHQYYPGNHGIAGEVETPIEFGTLGIAVDAITFRGTTAQQVTTSTNTMAVDWRGRVAIGSNLAVRGGARIGDFHMLFHDPRFKDPGATPDHSTESFLIGPTAAIDVRIFRSLTATVAGSWVYMPTATRTKVTNLAVLGGYSFRTPQWLQDFLR